MKDSDKRNIGKMFVHGTDGGESSYTTTQPEDGHTSVSEMANISVQTRGAQNPNREKCVSLKLCHWFECEDSGKTLWEVWAKMEIGPDQAREIAKSLHEVADALENETDSDKDNGGNNE